LINTLNKIPVRIFSVRKLCLAGMGIETSGYIEGVRK